MKKIGILFGQENTYPQAFVDRVNAKKPEGIVAEWVRIDKVIQAETDAYAVIIDRISQDVPFYRAYLKNAALSGTAVINNPFWWTADDKFFNNGLAEKIGVAVPRSVLLPSNQHPPNTDSQFHAESDLSARMGIDLRLCRLSGIPETVFGRRLEKCLPGPQCR